MNTEYAGIILVFFITIVLAVPLGKYMARMYRGQKNIMDFMAPLERFIFRICGIDPATPMNWKQFLKAMLTINLLWFVYGFFVLMLQHKLPFNPDHNPGQSSDLAFNSIVSFVTNTNLQDYSGETGATYLTQLFIFTFLQFTSAATGMACLIGLFNALKEKSTQDIGNFWNLFLKSITRLLLPLSIIVSIIFVFNGMPSGFQGKDTVITLQGDTMQVSRGPAAAMIAIKQLGTNGGGYFGANSAHPFENANYLTNMVELISIVLISMASIFALGYYTGKKKFAYVIFGTMTVLFLVFCSINIYYETKGSPWIARLGVNQDIGAMEGKEIRLGSASTAFWSVLTTSTSNGSVNGMHDSLMPVSGAVVMIDMMINALYGGLGVGLLNYYIYIIIAVFISGLMVGRTPEFMGHKVEAREVKIAALVTILSAFLIKVGTAISTYLYVHKPDANWDTKPSAWLNNPGYHGFSEMLYQYTSSNANNGSGFEGLADSNIFFNVSTGIVMILARFIPIIGPVAIAGILAGKKYIPESAGTLRTDSATFGAMTLAVIIIITALSYFPPLALGPIAEHFSFK